MPYSNERLTQIFERTDGRCHICWRRLRFGSYGQPNGWEVEHSRARCKGGSDRICNLFPAHITCNRQKGKLTSRTARNWNGRSKAPLSRNRKDRIRNGNRWAAGALGGLAGALGGPALAVAGAVVGALIGDSIDPEGQK